MGPEGARRRQKKSHFDEQGTFDPRVKEFDIDYLKKKNKYREDRMTYIGKEWPKSTLFN